jgi:alkanesulfonate monooxygenase SsuD/methylene tetrahydromethanopterin reductase-like flavin-dependent oxidoreductase (luciferase family)
VGQACIFTGHTIYPAKPRQTFEPLFSFGGYCPDALALCAEQCDVDLMWFEFKTRLSERMKPVHAETAEKGRTRSGCCAACVGRRTIGLRDREAPRDGHAPSSSGDIRITSGRSILGRW